MEADQPLEKVAKAAMNHETKNGDVIGMLYIGVKEQGSGELVRAITETRICRTGRIAIVNSNGVILVHPQRELVGRNVTQRSYCTIGLRRYGI